MILESVRKALASRTPPRPVRPGPAAAGAPPTMPADAEGLFEMFRDRLREVGGNVERAADPAGIRDAFAHVLRTHGAKKVWIASSPLLDPLDLESVCRAEGAERSRVLPSEKPLDLDVSVTGADLAVAETGSVAHLAKPGDGRSFSLLATVHVAILPLARIVPDLDAYLRWLEPIAAEGNRSCATLITGPSRTGDIEMILTMGVHGPKATYALVLG